MEMLSAHEPTDREEFVQRQRGPVNEKTRPPGRTSSGIEAHQSTPRALGPSSQKTYNVVCACSDDEKNFPLLGKTPSAAAVNRAVLRPGAANKFVGAPEWRPAVAWKKAAHDQRNDSPPT